MENVFEKRISAILENMELSQYRENQTTKGNGPWIEFWATNKERPALRTEVKATQMARLHRLLGADITVSGTDLALPECKHEQVRDPENSLLFVAYGVKFP